MSIPCYIQLRQLRQQSPHLYQQYWSAETFKILLVSGLALSLHFCCWIVSLDITSLAHAFVLICTSPLWMSVYIVLLAVAVRGPMLSAPELLGTICGFGGAAILVADFQRGDESSVAGDLIAAFGAICFVVYLLAGARLRAWMVRFFFVEALVPFL
jgi:drug/metabolite transporter (DMT)-like permease